MFCSKCGAPNPEGAYFCQQCSAPLPVAPGQAGAPVATTAWAQLPVVYAGFWRRFGAYIIDALIFGLPVGFVFGLVSAAITATSTPSYSSSYSYSSEPSPVATCLPLIINVVSIAIAWLYFAGFEASSKQATPGKMVLGIIVTDVNGSRISFGRASGRFFAKIVSGLILGIGYLMAGFTEKKQALHDMMAGCLVVRK